MLDSGNPIIITTVACETNRFNSNTEPCLSEALLRTKYGDAIAYFGSSGKGYSVGEAADVNSSFLYNEYFLKSRVVFRGF